MTERNMTQIICELHTSDIKQLDLIGKVLNLCQSLFWALIFTWAVIAAIIFYLVSHAV